MRTRWEWILLPSLIIVGGLIAASQYIFLHTSFYQDLGLGRTGNLTRLFVDVGNEKQLVLEARPQDVPQQPGAHLHIGWRPVDSRVLVE